MRYHYYIRGTLAPFISRTYLNRVPSDKYKGRETSYRKIRYGWDTIEVNEVTKPGVYVDLESQTENNFIWTGTEKKVCVNFDEIYDYLEMEAKKIERNEKLNSLI